MNRIGKFTAVAATLAALMSGAAHAQFAKMEDAVKYRQAAFVLMSSHMGRLAAMARGDRPFDPAAAQASARVVEGLSHLPWEAFVVGSSSRGLKVEPWSDGADFKARAEKFVSEAAKLPTAVASLDGLKQQLGATGAACKQCHDKYRNSN